MTPEINEGFRSQFLNFFRSGQLNKWDKALFFIAPEFVYRKNAGLISQHYRKLKWPNDAILQKHVVIENYSGTNPVAIKISEYLAAKGGDQLLGAYVHGSVGNSEEVPYSDFDGLVILKSKCIENKEALLDALGTLKETEQMMLEMDPLQHHGWFIMTEAELADYPEYYFPHVLFTYAKCLLGSNKLTIQMRESGYSGKFLKSFHHLTDSILRKLKSKSFLENRYVFKNLLSEFMLMPAVFIQAVTGRGVFKKFSFELLHKEVGEKYRIMDEISTLRQEWNYKASDLFESKLKKMNGSSAHRIQKACSGNLPDELINKFDDALLHRMTELVNDLKRRLRS